MEHFVIAYRDPLFGIIVFFALVATISLAAYIAGRVKRAEKERQMGEFLHSFGMMVINDTQFEHFLQTNHASSEALTLLAGSFERSGEYEKAIKLYVTLLSHLKEGNGERAIFLESLGRCYFKAGFLFKAKNIFLEVLLLSPHQTTTLTLLTSLYFSLGEYKQGLEVLDALKEHNVDTSFDEEIFHIMMIERSTHTTEEKLLLLEPFIPSNIFACRTYLQLSFEAERLDVWHKLLTMPLHEFVDLFWYLPLSSLDLLVIEQNPFLREVFAARNIGTSQAECGYWEIDILNALDKNSPVSSRVDIAFEYLCDGCKHSLPLPFVRCPHCSSLGRAKLHMSLAHKIEGVRYE